MIEERIRRKFNKGCVDYRLLEDGDKILVAVSGGKDSLELLRLLAARQRIFRPSIRVEAAHVVMDNIPYETDRSYLEQFCRELDVALHILHGRFDESTDARKTKCFLCAHYRRKILFEFATEHHFNKVALGHHQDDFLVTLLMNMTFEGNLSSMSPSMAMEHYPITLIRPLCLIPEADIRQVATKLNFHDQKTRCPYEQETQRNVMEGMLAQFEAINPEARHSLWRALNR